MSVTGSGSAMSAALNALHLYSRRVDVAAAQIARAGLVDLSTDDPGESSSAPPPAGAEGGAADLSDAMVNMMIAQRAFSAQLRVLRTADEMLKDTVETVR